MINKDPKLEKKRISILGCGWLGFRLAKRLLELDITSQIKGSTTSDSKLVLFKNAGVEGYVFDLNPTFSAEDSVLQSFLNTDSLVISIPPKLSQHESGFHLAQIRSIVSFVKKSSVKEIIYISSTGVYPDLNRVVNEEDVISPEQSASPEFVWAENTLSTLRTDFPEMKISVLRLGGIIGYERIPGKYVKGKKDMTTGSLPVNYIHPDDAVQIMSSMLQNGLHNETFNIVAPQHPTRREVYEATCAQFGWESPTFIEQEPKPNFKIISGRKLSELYDYDFKYPNPLKFHYEMLD